MSHGWTLRVDAISRYKQSKLNAPKHADSVMAVKRALMTAKRVISVVTTAGLLSLLVASSRAEKHPQDKRHLESVTLEEALADLGRSNHYFFTVEYAWKPGDFTSWVLRATQVQKPRQNSSLWKELERLRHKLPNFTYTLNQGNPRIIHIMDSRLANLQGYGLDRIIDRIDFSGDVYHLINDIGGKGVPISSRGPIDVQDLPNVDQSSNVHVMGQRLSVRDALSNFISLEGRGPILWKAATKLPQGEITYVQFLGHP